MPVVIREDPLIRYRLQVSKPTLNYSPNSIENKWRYIDKNGNPVIEPRFDSASPFSEGLAPVGLNTFDNSNGSLRIKCGYIDKSGIIVIEPRFDGAGPFSEGLVSILSIMGWRYIDKSGNIVIDPQSGAPFGVFSNGLAMIGQLDGTSRYIDRTGVFVWEPTMQTSDQFS